MWSRLTPDVIASAIVGMTFVMSGIGVYVRTKSPKIDGAYKVEGPASSETNRQLERIAQALEDMVAADKDSFQQDMRNRFKRLEEVMEHQSEEKRRRDV